MSPRIRAHVNPLAVRQEYSFGGFGNKNPIIIDVGACRGEFALELVQKFPQKNFILFEIRIPLAEKLRKQFSKFPNVIVFDGDAGRNFRSILVSSAGVLETIYINFPDPWFKDKHKKRRFLHEKFLSECAEWIHEKTTFVFQTDQQFLFEETFAIVQKSAFCDIHKFNTPPFGIMTDWEQVKRKKGEKIWRMEFKKPTP
ncbi:hypothetical protein K9L27_00375 [Candidatus Gracilibacteria bacterium]|nr:hypothetical protein [Candidatus Gracilibacteria bacterium]